MPNTTINSTDLTWRHDRSGNMVVGKRAEYVVNTVEMLFNMYPGTDEYEPERGLAIGKKKFQPHLDKTRDTQYENDIVKQFTTYTDLVPSNVLAMYVNEGLRMYMQVRFQGNVYEIDLEYKNDTLSAVLRNNKT